MRHIAIKRSAQSVLHRALIARNESDRLGELIADCLMQPGNFEKAAARYGTTDEFVIGELAAKEYVATVLRQ